MQSEYIFQILAKGLVLSLVFVCHGYNRLQGGTLYGKIYEVLYASVYILPESEKISQGSKLVYFSLRIQVWGHCFQLVVTCAVMQNLYTDWTEALLKYDLIKNFTNNIVEHSRNDKICQMPILFSSP